MLQAVREQSLRSNRSESLRGTTRAQSLRTQSLRETTRVVSSVSTATSGAPKDQKDWMGRSKTYMGQRNQRHRNSVTIARESISAHIEARFDEYAKNPDGYKKDDEAPMGIEQVLRNLEMDSLKGHMNDMETASRATTMSTMSTCGAGSMDIDFKEETHVYDDIGEHEWNESQKRAKDVLVKDGEQLAATHAWRSRDLEEKCMNEARRFNADWAARLIEFDRRQATNMHVFKENQAQMHAEYMKQTNASVPLQPKWSPEYLRLVRSSLTLKKQGKFVEARLRWQKAEALKATEQAAWTRSRETKIAMLEAGFLKKQANSAAFLQEKQAAERRAMLLQQKEQRDRLAYKCARKTQQDGARRAEETNRHVQRMKSARYGRHGAAICPDLKAGHFRSNWNNNKSDLALPTFASPEYF